MAGEKTERMILAEEAMDYIQQEFAPLVHSMAAQGHENGLKAMRVMSGIDVLRDYVTFLHKHQEAIRRAVGK